MTSEQQEPQRQMHSTDAATSGPFTARAPYGRHSRRDEELARIRREGPAALQPYDGENYYGLHPLKAGHYKWLIAQYFFIGGIGGAAQVISTVVDLVGDEEDRVLVRHGRYIALAGASLSPIFLIADLHTPGRWYNMLRIYRPTSPMSVGSWVMTAFGVFSGLTALAQLREDLSGGTRGRLMGRVFGVPAALTGTVFSYYTGTLISATSVPLWASVPRLLPALFSTSAAATAASALTLTAEAAGASEETQRRLERFETVAGGAELAVTAGLHREWRRQRLDGPLHEQPISAAYKLGAIGLGIAVPLAIHGYQMLTGRKSKTAITVAAVSTLVGGFCLRASILFAGRRSAQRPQDYFRFSQPAAERQPLTEHRAEPAPRPAAEFT